MTRLVCSHGICGTCLQNEMKLKTTISICGESGCNNIIPVTSINKFLQENSDLVEYKYIFPTVCSASQMIYKILKNSQHMKHITQYNTFKNSRLL